MSSIEKQKNASLHLLDKELRHVEASKLTKLSAIIDKDKGWKLLLQELTRPKAGASFCLEKPLPILNLTLDAINLIEQQIYCGKSPTLALLNHWSITGRRRPTIRSLIIYLRICNLKWAEDFVLQSVLGVNLHSMPPVQAPVTSKEYDIDTVFKFDQLEELIKNLEVECARYSFRLLYETTNGFCDRPYDPISESGTKIGEGRFSAVFRAKTQLESSHPKGAQEVFAAKLLRSDCNQKYLANEINLMVKVKHENILDLLGIAVGKCSSDSFSYICLIYQYMENGSLLECLSSGLTASREKAFISWKDRVKIATKVARGISHLHSFHEGPIVHRDIKTANILISHDLEPKIGDFTLVRHLENIHTGETQHSQNVIGTSVYMPPEAFRGDISKKFDVFSYGIVLFELLTGLRPFNDELDEDLLTFISERLSDIEEEYSSEQGICKDESAVADKKDKFLQDTLDEKAGDWHLDSAKALFKLALQATEINKKNRPDIASILPDIEQINSLAQQML